jgi:hypothetical protein
MSVDSLLTPKQKATQFTVVNRVHSRLSPTQPFSKRLPTLINNCLTLTKIPLKYTIILRFRWETSNPIELEKLNNTVIIHFRF